MMNITPQNSAELKVISKDHGQTRFEIPYLPRNEKCHLRNAWDRDEASGSQASN